MYCSHCNNLLDFFTMEREIFMCGYIIAVDLTATTKKKKEDKPKDRDIERRIVRVKYLMEKYGNRWRERVALRKSMCLGGVFSALPLFISNCLFKPC